MASLFGKKEEEKNPPAGGEEATPVVEATKKETKAVTHKAVVDGKEDIARVLAQPRMTEKATLGIDKGVYVFNVAPDTNKKQIKEAIKLVYKVDPVKIHVTTIRRKSVRNSRTGMKGVKSGGKKAYVYLKKGDTISLM
ncbi:50S ribosomal protein L23 [Candidatus Kaiserbacteria bacterium]|nr:MAG: 50S ribosomal protein L23 [Candidatus Kaiserbacteria bacterium]